MQDRNDSNNVGEMVHVVCIPFTIRRRDGDKACLRDIAQALGEQWEEKPDARSVDEKLQEYQAQAYFHPFVRRFLFDPCRVKRFQHKDVAALTVDLDSQLTGPFPITLDAHCELALFQPDIGILLLETVSRQPLALQKAQLLIDTLRRLYPPYFTSFPQDKPTAWQGGHCPVSVTLLDRAGNAIGKPGSFREDAPEKFSTYLDAMLKKGGEPAYPLAAHWQTLLAAFDFAGDGNAPYLALQLGDDRAPIMTWLAVDNLRAIDPGNWVRTCFADEPGDSRTPYAGKFLQNFERDFCYDRYWYADDDENEYPPSRILNCGYAFSFVGSAKSDFFTKDALFNFRHIYVEMGMIAHFQKAALLAASRRLSQLVGRNEAGITMPDQGEVRAFYDQFVEFTQNFWFDEISPQEQGRELFQMWREHLRIQELYDEVRQELKDLVDYTEMRATGDLNKKVYFFGSVGIVIAFLSLLSSIFGMNKPEDFCWYHGAGAIASVAGFIGLLIFAWQKGLLKRNTSP